MSPPLNQLLTIIKRDMAHGRWQQLHGHGVRGHSDSNANDQKGEIAMRRTHLVSMVLTIFALTVAAMGYGQVREGVGSGEATPRLIKFNGAAKDGAGVPRVGSVGVTFSLYAAQEGEEPLWRESQVVDADIEGRYTAYLGASEKEGVPLELFSTGRAQWLGVQVQGEKEEPRVLLVAVPYALKAADADTMGGRPLSSFVLYEDLKTLQETDAARVDKVEGAGISNAKNQEAATRKSLGTYLLEKLSTSGSNRNYFTTGITPVFQIDGSGTTNHIAKFVDGNNIGDSGMTDVNGNIGVGTATPDKRFQIASTPTLNAELHIGGTGDETKDIFAGMGVNLDTGPAFNYGYSGHSFGRSSGFFNVRPDASAAPPNPSLRFMNVNQQRMIITNTGDVGIGTMSPTSKLTVAGTIESTAVHAGPGMTGTPLAYGFFSSAGVKSTGSDNISCIWSGGSSWYDCTVVGEDYFYSDYITTVTPASGPLFAGTSSIGGHLVVRFFDLSGAPVQASSGFAVVIYKH